MPSKIVLRLCILWLSVEQFLAVFLKFCDDIIAVDCYSQKYSHIIIVESSCECMLIISENYN